MSGGEEQALFFLFFVDLLVSATIGSTYENNIAYVYNLPKFNGLVVFTVCFWLYPIVGLIATLLCEFLARLSLTSRDKWSKEQRIGTTALFPLVTIFWIMFFVPLFVFNRMQ